MKQVTLPGSMSFAVPVSIVLLMVLSAALVLYATSIAPHVNTDGIHYMSAAQSLMDGNGFRYPLSQSNPSLFPPLFPWALALSARATALTVESAARWLNAGLAALTVLLSISLICRGDRRRLPAAVVAVLIMMPALGDLYRRIVSEPLFIVLMLVTALMLARHLQRPSLALLVGAACCAALATLTRYLGASLVAAAVVCLLIAGARPLRARVGQGILFAAISIAPVAAFLLLQGSPGEGAIVGRRLHVYPLPPEKWSELLATVGEWTAPLPMRDSLDVAAGAAALVGLVLISLWLVRVARSPAQEPARSWRPLPASATLLTFFSVALFAQLAATLLFLDPGVRFSVRLLAPVFVAMVIVMTGLAADAWPRLPMGLRRAARVLVGAYAAGMLALGAYGAYRVNATADVGYASPVLRELETVRLLAALPADVPIFTNRRAAIEYLTGNRAVTLPVLPINPSEAEVRQFEADMTELERVLLDSDGVVVYFDFDYFADTVFPTPDALMSRMPLYERPSDYDAATVLVTRARLELEAPP